MRSSSILKNIPFLHIVTLEADTLFTIAHKEWLLLKHTQHKVYDDTKWLLNTKSFGLGILALSLPAPIVTECSGLCRRPLATGKAFLFRIIFTSSTSSSCILVAVRRRCSSSNECEKEDSHKKGQPKVLVMHHERITI